MTDKKSFLIYKSWGTLMESLDDATAGILVKAIFAYQRGEEVDIQDPVLSAVFQVIRKEFEENDEKYQETCERNRGNVKKRWEKAKGEDYESIRKDTTVYDRIRTDTKHTDIDPDIEPDSELEPELEPEKEAKASKKRKTSKREVEVIEAYASDPVLNATIHEFIDFRKQIKAPMSDIALTKMLAKLDKIGKSDHERIEILNESMANGWKGIFPLDKVKPRRQEIDWEAL